MSELAVVVINWNRAAATLGCLEKLSRWRRLRPEIWVVDNASGDDCAELVTSRFPTVTLLRSESNLGFGGGNNLALRRVTSPFVLLLNNDAAIGETAVTSLITVLRDRPRVAVAGPVLVTPSGTGERLTAGGRDISRHIGTHVPEERLEPGALAGRQPLSVQYVPGTVALLRTEALAQVGLFDEEYFFSGEMADLCERIRRHGYECVVAPWARAAHDLEVAAGDRGALYSYYSLRNRFLFIRKFRRRQRALLLPFWLAYGLFHIARSMLRGRWPAARAAGLALHDALAGRFGGQNRRVAGHA